MGLGERIVLSAPWRHAASQQKLGVKVNVFRRSSQLIPYEALFMLNMRVNDLL